MISLEISDNFNTILQIVSAIGIIVCLINIIIFLLRRNKNINNEIFKELHRLGSRKFYLPNNDFDAKFIQLSLSLYNIENSKTMNTNNNNVNNDNFDFDNEFNAFNESDSDRSNKIITIYSIAYNYNLDCYELVKNDNISGTEIYDFKLQIDRKNRENFINLLRKLVSKLDFYKNRDEVKIMAYKSDDAKNRIDLNIVVPEYNKLELFLKLLECKSFSWDDNALNNLIHFQQQFLEYCTSKSKMKSGSNSKYDYLKKIYNNGNDLIDKLDSYKNEQLHLENINQSLEDLYKNSSSNNNNSSNNSNSFSFSNHRKSRIEKNSNNEIMSYGKQHFAHVTIYDQNALRKVNNEKSQEDSHIAEIHKEIQKTAIPANQHKVSLLVDDYEKILQELVEEFPNFEPVITYLKNLFAKNKLGNSYFYWRPILIIGPAGIGKSCFIKRFIEKFNSKYKIFNANTAQHGAVLTGSSKFYSNCEVGYIFKFLLRNTVVNPIFVAENIDKITKRVDFPSFMEALLNVIDPETSKNFIDECIDEVPINASYINWFATAHSESKINKGLVSLFKVFRIQAPNINQTEVIAQNIYQQIHKNLCFKPNIFNAPLTDNVVKKISRLKPSDIYETLETAISNAIQNKHFDILESDLDMKYINIHSNKLESNNEYTIPAELFNYQDYENFRDINYNSNDARSETIHNITEKILPCDSYKIRLLMNEWQKILDEFETKFPNFTEFAETIRYQFFLNSVSHKHIYWKPILFSGEAGIGKTFAAQWLAEKMNVPFFKIDMANVSDNQKLVGINKLAPFSKPGKIFEILAYQPIVNPIIILDELEKCTEAGHYAALSPLYTLLEATTNNRFIDECADFSIDASRINWIATVNDLSRLPEPIKSRFEILTIEKPNKEQNIIISQNIYKNICEELLLKMENFDDKDKNSNENSKNIISNIFAENLSEEVLAELTNFVPRDIQKIIYKAMGFAQLNNRNYLIATDIKEVINKNFKTNKSIGFIK